MEEGLGQKGKEGKTNERYRKHGTNRKRKEGMKKTREQRN